MDNFFKALIHISSWLVGFFIIYYLMDCSNIRINYGLITGWWVSTYVGYIANVRIRAVPIVFLIFELIVILLFISGQKSFYHDAPETINIFMVFIFISQGLVFTSPIFFNEIIKRIVGFVYKKHNQKIQRTV